MIKQRASISGQAGWRPHGKRKTEKKEYGADSSALRLEPSDAKPLP